MLLRFLILILLVNVTVGYSQTEPVYRTATNIEPFQQGTDGTLLLLVRTSGEDKNIIDENAKKIAIYNAIFVGYPEANGIPKAEPLAKSSLYDEKKVEFTKFIEDPSTPAKYGMKVTNHPSIPLSKVSKKLIEGPVIVSLNLKALRSDLEEKGYIKSTSQLGYKPAVTILPDEAWLVRKGYFTEVDNQGTIVKVWKYREAIIDSEFKIISDNFKSKYEKLFEIKSLSDALDNRSNQDLVNNQSADGIVQSVESKIASVLNADLFIKIDISNTQVNGMNRSTVTIKCTDTYILNDVINGQPTTKDSREDIQNTTKAAFLGAIDDVYPRIVDYFFERNDNGIQGVVNIEIAGSLAGEVDFETPVTINSEETTIKRAVKQVLAKQVQKDKQSMTRHELDGLSDKTRLAYKKVYLPIYFVDPDTDSKEKNSFNNLGKVIQDKLKTLGFTSDVISTGLGSVNVRITGKK